MGLQAFGWQALWHPGMMVLTLILAIIYLEVIGPLRPLFPGSKKVSSKQKTFFFSSLILLYIAQGSPIDLYAHVMFSAHMVQMSMFLLMFPPLMLLGLPDWLLRAIFRLPVLGWIAKKGIHPIVSTLLFNGVFSLYHVPAVFDYAMLHEVFHLTYSGVLLTTAFFMWFSLISPLEEMKRLSGLQKMGYIFANGVLITPACALIIFAGDTLYATYTDPALWAEMLRVCVPGTGSFDGSVGPSQLSWFSPLQDQQLGGVLMKIIQEIVYGVALTAVFVEWVRYERKRDGRVDLNPKVPLSR